jgi:hypothetical protein
LGRLSASSTAFHIPSSAEDEFISSQAPVATSLAKVGLRSGLMRSLKSGSSSAPGASGTGAPEESLDESLTDPLG